MEDNDFSNDDLKALLLVNNEAEFLEFSNVKTTIFLSYIKAYLKNCNDANILRLLDKCIKQFEREIEYFTSSINRSLHLGNSVDFPKWLFKNINEESVCNEPPVNLINAYKNYNLITTIIFSEYKLTNTIPTNLSTFIDSINVFNNDMIRRLETLYINDTPRSPEIPKNINLNVVEKLNINHSSSSPTTTESTEPKTQDIAPPQPEKKKDARIDPNINLNTVIEDCEKLIHTSMDKMKKTYQKLENDNKILSTCNTELSKFHEMGLDVTHATQSLAIKKNNIHECLIKYSNKILKLCQVLDANTSLLNEESKKLGPSDKMRKSISN